MSRRVALGWLALTVVAVLAPARGDVLCLRDGRIVEGKKLARVEGGIEVGFEHGKLVVPDAQVLEVLIEGEAAPEPANAEEAEQRAKGFVRFEGKWITVKRRDELVAQRIAERRRAIEAFKARKLWRNRATEKTKNFAFEFTLSDELFASYRDLMETYFKEFCRDWKVRPPKDLGPLSVCLYGDRAEFNRTSGAGAYVLGYFKFVQPMELDFYFDRRDPAETEEVMFHETNHYLQKLIDVDFAYPHFPGESLAEYYGASRWDPVKKKIETGLVLEGRLVEVQNDVAGGEHFGLEKLVSGDGLYEHYTWGWSLVHFLMNQEAYAAKFHEFVLALPKAKDIRRVAQIGNLQTVEPAEVWRAFQSYLGLKDRAAVQALEKQWHAYVDQKLAVVSPRGLELAAFSATRMYPPRPIKAKRLLKEAIDKGSTNALAYFEYAELLADDGDHSGALPHLNKAIELAPLEAEFHERLGLELAACGKRTDGEREHALAREIDPDAFDD